MQYAFGSLAMYAQRVRSQYWKPARLARAGARKLGSTLAAAGRIPFYAARWPSDPDLRRLPVLKRGDVAELNASVRALYPADQPFDADRSSGSTGMPAEFLFDAPHQRGRFACRLRYLRTHGWSPLRRSAWIIYLPEGTPDGHIVRSKALGRTRFLSTFESIATQCEWLRALRPEGLYTLPSNLDQLLDASERTGYRPHLKWLMCGGEVVEDGLRARARALWGLEIADNYGSTEMMIAWQCPKGRYHVNEEHVLLELLDEDDRPVPPGEPGRVVVTTLENRLMPLVRYEIGDWAVASEVACACGRTLRCLERVIGRGINLFRMPDGRVLSPWALVVRFKGLGLVRQFQIVQRTVRDFGLRYVADHTLAPDAERRLAGELRAVLGPDVSLAFERCDAIERTRAGKFMTALSNVPKESEPCPTSL